MARQQTASTGRNTISKRHQHNNQA